VFFFFSSRRRHTRSKRDWSSDVCSSDLDLINRGEIIDFLEHGEQVATNVRTPYLIANISKIICDVPALLISRSIGDVLTNHKNEIGRASCREGAYETGGRVTLKEKE